VVMVGQETIGPIQSIVLSVVFESDSVGQPGDDVALSRVQSRLVADRDLITCFKTTTGIIAQLSWNP